MPPIAMKATGDPQTSPVPPQKSTLIEFPGVSRNALPEWRKELSERVREVQERRAREAAHEAAEAERQRATEVTNPPQLNLLPRTETPAMNPLVAAALKRIERAHQSASVEARPPRTSLATAVAYAPEREENPMNETDPPTIQLEFESEAAAVEVLEPVVEKSHLAIVPTPSETLIETPVETRVESPIKAPLESPLESFAAKAEPAQAPRRLIVENDPSLNYLDSICRSVRVDDIQNRSASAFRRVVCALLDLICCALLTAPIAGALYLAGD